MTRPFQTIDEEIAKGMWREWNEPFVWDRATVAWLNNRPTEIIKMMLKFPADAKVKGTRQLDCPKPNEVGIVASWFESGLISVAVPGRPIKAQCQEDWIEVIEHRTGMSPDAILKNLLLKNHMNLDGHCAKCNEVTETKEWDCLKCGFSKPHPKYYREQNNHQQGIGNGES